MIRKLLLKMGFVLLPNEVYEEVIHDAMEHRYMMDLLEELGEVVIRKHADEMYDNVIDIDSYKNLH